MEHILDASGMLARNHYNYCLPSRLHISIAKIQSYNVILRSEKKVTWSTASTFQACSTSLFSAHAYCNQSSVFSVQCSLLTRIAINALGAATFYDIAWMLKFIYINAFPFP